MACRPQIEICIADAADHGFLVLQLREQPRGEIEPVHHLGVAGRCVCFRAHAIAHLSKTLPPVKSGDRISATGACVVMASLIHRSTMNSNSPSRVPVCCSIASASSTARMVHETSYCPY